jgi:hypothetical protein
MNTQGNLDFVYLADSTTLLKEKLFAKFGGTSKPPVVVSSTNEVLVWFLTDKTNTHKGWEFEYEFVD